MARLHFCSFLFVFLLKAAPKCRGSAGTETVSALKDEDVALLCLNPNITDSPTCYRIRLTKYTGASQQSVIFEHPKKSQDAKRVSLEANRRGQSCVFLKTLQKSDEAMYSVEIWKGWNQIDITNISLKVKDCRILKPEIAKAGLSVRLDCSVDVETTPLNVTWAKMKGNIPVPVDLTRAEMRGAFLTIQSVFANDSSWYRCDYILGQSQRCSTINLHVKGHQVEDVFATTLVPSPAFTENQQAFSQVLQTKRNEGSETLILVVVLVTTLIIILAALTGVFIYKRCKTKRNFEACFTENGDLYENGSLPCSRAATNRVNSLYEFPEENRVCG